MDGDAEIFIIILMVILGVFVVQSLSSRLFFNTIRFFFRMLRLIARMIFRLIFKKPASGRQQEESESSLVSEDYKDEDETLDTNYNQTSSSYQTYSNWERFVQKIGVLPQDVEESLESWMRFIMPDAFMGLNVRKLSLHPRTILTKYRMARYMMVLVFIWLFVNHSLYVWVTSFFLIMTFFTLRARYKYEIKQSLKHENVSIVIEESEQEPESEPDSCDFDDVSLDRTEKQDNEYEEHIEESEKSEKKFFKKIKAPKESIIEEYDGLKIESKKETRYDYTDMFD